MLVFFPHILRIVKAVDQLSGDTEFEYLHACALKKNIKKRAPKTDDPKDEKDGEADAAADEDGSSTGVVSVTPTPKETQPKDTPNKDAQKDATPNWKDESGKVSDKKFKTWCQSLDGDLEDGRMLIPKLSQVDGPKARKRLLDLSGETIQEHAPLLVVPNVPL